MAKFRNTSYTERAPDSPNERFGLGSSSQSRTFDIMDGSFQGRMQAAYDILGYGTVLATGNQTTPYYLSRVTPMPAPALPAVSYLLPPDALQTLAVPDMTNQFWANGISRVEPLGSPQGVDLRASPVGTAAAKYNRARLFVEFSSLPFQILPDSAVISALTGVPDEGQALQAEGWPATRYISRQIETFCRVIEVPFGLPLVQYRNAAVAAKSALPKREGGANVTYTWMRVPLTGPVPALNFDAVNSLLGTLNSQMFDGFPAGTLMFDSYSTREYQGSFGERLADVRYNMVFLPHPSTGANFNSANFNGDPGPAAGTKMGWNSFFAVDPVTKIADYYPVVIGTANPTPPYPLASTIKDTAGNALSFADLFRPTRVAGRVLQAG